ncbi:MAG: universal stress protein [Candidatus Bathyarchaeia archaeon]
MADKPFLKRILVPIDGSSSSLMAEKIAALIAKRTQAEVNALHIMQELRLAYRLPSSVQDELLGMIEQRAKQVIESAKALFSEENVKVEAETMGSSDPAESILEFSKDFDLIVMGSRGENEKDPYALGSITKKVVRHSKCPTLIVKKVSQLSNFLVCLDGSENSIKALNYGVNLAEKLDSRVTLLNVQERRLYDSSPKAAEEMGEKIISRAIDSIGVSGKNVKIDRKLNFGVPSDVIADVAEKENYDLIILGSRGLGTVQRFLLGSVSDDVTHKAKCSVLIVPASS